MTPIHRASFAHIWFAIFWAEPVVLALETYKFPFVLCCMLKHVYVKLLCMIVKALATVSNCRVALKNMGAATCVILGASGITGLSFWLHQFVPEYLGEVIPEPSPLIGWYAVFGCKSGVKNESFEMKINISSCKWAPGHSFVIASHNCSAQPHMRSHTLAY